MVLPRRHGCWSPLEARALSGGGAWLLVPAPTASKPALAGWQADAAETGIRTGPLRPK